MTKEHLVIWKRYFSDFVHYKLRLESSDPGEDIAKDILYALYGELGKEDPNSEIIIIHLFDQVYHLNLAKLTAILKQLNKIQKVCSDPSLCIIVM